MAAIWNKRNELRIPTQSITLKYTPEEVRLLGTMPDEELARKLGRSLQAIRHRRNKLGIANFTTEQNKWTAEEDSWLGKFTDREVAERIGCHPGTVGDRRRQLGIPALDPNRWTKEEEKLLLEKVPIKELVKKLKRSPAAIRAHCHQKGIATPPQTRPWTPEEDRLLGTASDAEIARKIGRCFWPVCERRQALGILKADIKPRNIPYWTPARDKLLGTMPDGVLAKRLGKNLRAVFFRRRRLGIPRFGGPIRRWTSEEERLLGTVSDRDLAPVLKRTRRAIAFRREMLGIAAPPWGKNKIKNLACPSKANQKQTYPSH